MDFENDKNPCLTYFRLDYPIILALKNLARGTLFKLNHKKPENPTNKNFDKSKS